MTQPDPTDIEAAFHRIQGHVRTTPCLEFAPGELAPARVVLKLEQLQVTGSFKARGAFNALLQIPQADKSSGVIAASGGNHGIAVAHAAQSLGMHAEIFVPEIASPVKVARLQALGARVTQTGSRYADSLAAMEARRLETGAVAIHAYDQPAIVAGQGTLAREFEQQCSGLDAMVIAVGGGGLIGGAMAWLQSRLPLVAVEPANAATLSTAMSKGEIVDVEVGGIAADSLGARRIGRLSFDLAQRLRPKSVLLDDESIEVAQRWLYEHCRIVSEPGGATALAAIMSGRYPSYRDQSLGVVVCGGNADLTVFATDHQNASALGEQRVKH